jgi:hypothetical protein
MDPEIPYYARNPASFLSEMADLVDKKSRKAKCSSGTVDLASTTGKSAKFSE